MADLVRIGILAAVYFWTAKFGLMMDAVSGFATLVWPPAGISLAALLLFGLRLWPGVALGAFLINYSAGAPALAAFGMALGNTLEALAGAYWLQQKIGFRNSMDRLRDVLGLVTMAAVVSTMISATVGVSSLWMSGVVSPASFRSTWMAWWLGDMMGDLIVAPLLLTWNPLPSGGLRRYRVVEAACLAALVVVGGLIIFRDLAMSEPKFYSLPYLVFPLVIWAAVRFGPRATASVTFVISALAIWGMAQGTGPFRSGGLSDSLIYLQSFMGIVAVTAMVLAAAVSERVKSERTMKEYAGELEVANADLAMMIDVIAHDLKEPLRSIETFSQMLQERYAKEVDDRGRDYLRRVIRASVRMRQLLTDILSLSRLKQVDLKRERINGIVIAIKAIERLDARIRESHAVVRLGSQFPDLNVDKTLGIEAVYNLILNALKFSGEGRPPEIEVAAYQGPGGAGIVVKDRGPGVPVELSGRIFKLFERGVGREIEGTGAGLAIVRQVVERHGGKAWVEPREGGGSEFIISFGD